MYISTKPADIPIANPRALCVTTDIASKAWMRSLDRRNEICIRRLQFIFVDYMGFPIGASVNVVYNPKEREYKFDFKLDEGWGFGQMTKQQRLSVKIGTQQMLQALQYSCTAADDEVLSWNSVSRLVYWSLLRFGILDSTFGGGLRSWSARATLRGNSGVHAT